MTDPAKRILLLVSMLTLGACGSSSSGPSITSPPPPPPPPPPPVGAPAIDVQQVFTDLPTGFASPVSMVQAPGDPTRWFVVEQSGTVRVFTNDPLVNSSSVFVDISPRVASGGESGLLGIAFHPSWPGTPEVFLSYTAPGSPLISYVSRFVSADGGATLDAASEERLLTVVQESTNHNGGDLAFGQDGFLYASFGDGGFAGDPLGRSQDTSNLLGSILRIDVDGNSPYEIPVDNPFASPDLCLQGFSAGTPCPEIYAYGLRNPWRMSFDSVTGELWTGDVGQGAWEEVDRIELGGNYGWNVREGAHCYPPGSACADTFAEPVTEYDRSLGQAITGGYVYRGTAIPDLVGWYVFADYVQGRIFAVTADSQPTVVPEVLDETGLLISSFAEGLDGELYVLSFVTGTIFQIVAAP